MKLVQFRVTNFRSINDSGPIHVAKLTTLVGRNESGKSNLLLGLRSLNPPSGIEPLKPIKDFPRDRRLGECSDTTEVLETWWDLDTNECSDLVGLFPRAENVTQVTVSRDYKGTRYVGFIGLRARGFNYSEIAGRVRKIKPVLEARAEKVADQTARAALEAASSAFEAAALGSGLNQHQKVMAAARKTPAM